MSWRNRLAIVIFGIGTTLSGVWAYRAVSGVMAESGLGGGSESGGIGAVSIGLGNDAFGLLENVLPVVITFWLSAQIRNRGRTEQVLRRLHLLATLTLVAVLVLFVSQFFFRSEVFGSGRLGWGIFVGSFIAAVIWLPVQAFFAAGFLGLLIKGRSPIV